jgi:hypothetical protein
VGCAIFFHKFPDGGVIGPCAPSQTSHILEPAEALSTMVQEMLGFLTSITFFTVLAAGEIP